MVDPRLVTAFAGIAASLAVSVTAWWYLDTFLFFLLVPFVPLFFGRRGGARPTRRCPQCGFRTTDPEYEHCPRDGTRLVE